MKSFFVNFYDIWRSFYLCNNYNEVKMIFVIWYFYGKQISLIH